MNLLQKFLALISFGLIKVNDKVDEHWGAEISEAKIADGKESVAAGQKKLRDLEASLVVQSGDIKELKEKASQYESTLATLKSKHEQVEDESKKQEIYDLAKETKAKLNEVLAKIESKEEIYNSIKASLDKSKNVINDRKEALQRAEEGLDEVKAQQVAINIHEEISGITSGLVGDEFDSEGHLDKVKRKQSIKMASIDLENEANKKPESIESRLNKVLGEDNNEPW